MRHLIFAFIVSMFFAGSANAAVTDDFNAFLDRLDVKISTYVDPKLAPVGPHLERGVCWVATGEFLRQGLNAIYTKITGKKAPPPRRKVCSDIRFISVGYESRSPR